MKPAPFAYVRPHSVADALEALAGEGADARILAGGQSLAPMLNMRLVTPRTLVDIARLEELSTIRQSNGWIEIGAAVTQEALRLHPGLAATQPLLALVLPWTGHWQTRQRGTVCGSLAHADPSAELPLALCTLGGEVVIRSKRRTRTLAASAFQTGLMTTALAEDEMVVAARFPVAKPGAAFAFREIAQRHGDFAIAAIAAAGDAEGVTLGVGGVADTPAAERLPWLSGGDRDDALNDLAWRLGGRDDVHASARYRRDLVRRIGRRVVEEAHAQAGR